MHSDSGTAATKPPFEMMSVPGEGRQTVCPRALSHSNIVQPIYQWPSCHMSHVYLCRWHSQCPPSRNFLQDRVHSDSRSCPSCQILSAVWNPACPKLWQVFSTCITTGNAMNWMLTWMVNVWSMTPSQRTLVAQQSKNYPIAKLTGTSWGASTSTLRTSALALCRIPLSSVG